MGKKNTTRKSKYKPSVCDNKMSFQECELAILRQAVDESEELAKKKLAGNDDIKDMIRIVEDFISKKKLICYGGTAINNLLPKHARFYNYEYEVPDYDFYSSDAFKDAKELADLYFAAGYTDVEAKSGVHEGTYKVFVNFIPMADVTQMQPDLFKSVSNSSVSVGGIKYAPPNFLRMGMYLELSRPAGDTSRWEKVLKRLTLLNKYRPMKVDYDCENIDFQRKMAQSADDSERLYFTVRDTFIDIGVVFFGGYASSIYSRHMSKKDKLLAQKIPDFDVITEDPEKCATIVIERLHDEGFKKVKQIKHDAVSEIIPEHIEIQYENEILGFIYKPIACHNYNTITVGQSEINVATIDTIMSFYLAFLYIDNNYYYHDRTLCMAKYLFDLQGKNKLAQHGVLKRFGAECIGVQETMESIRAKKTRRFNELKHKRGSDEYNKFFLRYQPGADKPSDNKAKQTKRKRVTKPKKKGIYDRLKKLSFT